MLVTSKEYSEEKKESGAYIDKKSHEVVKSCLVRILIDSDVRQKISALKGSRVVLG